MVYLTSKHKLKDFTIVELDPENEGMIKKQTRTLSDNIKELDAKVIGYIQPDNVNGIATGYSNNLLYSVNINKDEWKQYLRYESF